MRSVLKAGKWCAYASALALGLSALAMRIPAQAVANGSANSIQALFVSDIHFEPFRDPGKAVQLAAAPIERMEPNSGCSCVSRCRGAVDEDGASLPHARRRHFFRSLPIEFACNARAG